MSKGSLIFLNGAIASVAGMIGGVVAFSITAIVYVAIGEIAAVFRMTIFEPSMVIIWIFYIMEVVAIAILVYRFMRRISRSCITA